MLENKKFVEWANENVIVVVGHTQTDHPTEITDDKGKKTPGCPLYVGMTCEQHRAIPGECRNPAEGLPKLTSKNTMPNSWFVAPDGTISEVDPAAQQVPGKIEELAVALQKESGKGLTWKKYSKYLGYFETSDKAFADKKIKDAIKALQKVEKDTKKLPDGMKAEVDKRIDAINGAGMDAFAEITGGSDEAAAKIKAANKLKTLYGLRFKRGYLPIVDEIKGWLKRAKAGDLSWTKPGGDEDADGDEDGEDER